MHRNEFVRYLLAILVMPPPSILWSINTQAESDVEGTPADVIDVTGPEKFAVRLFFDKQTHLPLLLSYRGTQAARDHKLQSFERQKH